MSVLSLVLTTGHIVVPTSIETPAQQSQLAQLLPAQLFCVHTSWAGRIQSTPEAVNQHEVRMGG